MFKLGTGWFSKKFAKSQAKKPFQYKVAIIVGHTKTHQGAINYLGETEYVFNTRLSKYLERGIKYKEGARGLEVRVFFNDGLTDEELAQEIDDWGASIALSLHFNSFRGKARGCEVLIDKHAPLFNYAFRQADNLSDRLAKEFKVFERRVDGVFVVEKGDRGHNILHELSQKCITGFLVEPCFANRKTKESMAIFENEAQYAAQLTFWLVDTMKGIKNGKLKEEART